MNPEKRVEEMVRSLRESAGAETHDRVLGRLLEVLKQRTKQPVGGQPALGRSLMKNPITRLAAAAVFIAGIGLLISLLIHTTTPAYALDQTVEANQQLRTLHITVFHPGYDEPKDFWVECDESGQIKNARWHMPAWDSPEDGAKVVVWKADTIQVWFQKKNGLGTWTRQNPPHWLLDAARTINPQLGITRLKDEQAQGKVDLQIEEPSDKAQPIVVTATYPPREQSPGRRTVLRVDQRTKLVTTIEDFTVQEGRYVLADTRQFSDYNVPIDPAFFDLDAIVPADVRRIDGDAMDMRGLPQGTLSDDEIAAEVVRQFFEALIAGDYEKAGQLYCGTPAEKLRQGFFGKIRVLRIVSMDKPTPHPTMPQIGGLRVPCKIEIEKDGAKSIWEPYGPFVRMTHRQMEHPRWEIHGGL